MTSDQRQFSTPTDDIDLLVLLERMILFFRKFRWVFVFAAVLGLLSGYFVYSRLANIYTSRMILHSYVLTNQEHIQIVQTWSELLRKKEYGELAAMLNCREDVFNKLKKLKAEEIQKVFANINPHGFIIEVNVTDNAILDELQQAIVYGLENNEYVKKRLDARKASLNVLIGQTSAEIQKLDSTKEIVANIVAGKARSNSSLIIDGGTANRQLLDMNEKLLGYKDELKFTNAVQVLQGFSKFKKPSGPNLIPWLVIGLLSFLSLAFLYSLLRSLMEKIKRHSISLKESTRQAV